MSRAFTPRASPRSRRDARELCAEFLDPQRDGTGFDYVEDFAAKIPTMLIGALLGVPEEDQDQLRIWGDLMLRFEPEGISAEKTRRASASFSAYMDAMVEDRAARTPRDDMVSDLARGRDHARRRLDAAPRAPARSWPSSRCSSSRGARPPPGCSAGPRCSSRATPTQRAKLVADPTLIPNASRSCSATRRRHRSRRAS